MMRVEGFFKNPTTKKAVTTWTLGDIPKEEYGTLFLLFITLDYSSVASCFCSVMFVFIRGNWNLFWKSICQLSILHFKTSFYIG